MNFLNPLAFVWAILIPLIVLLYFLKLKRREIPISSTFLWKKSVMDLRVNAPFQRLRKNLLLFLQILILAAFILALAQPFLDVRGFQRQSLIVLLDRSASMSAADGSGSRLKRAQEAAQALVGDLSSGDEMAVIAFSTTARIVSPFTNSKSTLRQGIREIRPGQGTTEITEALVVASNLARLRQNPEVILISDGRFPPGSSAGLDRARMQYVKVGEPTPNLGITALDLRRGLDMGGDVEAYLRVENFSEEERTVTLILEVNGREFDARQMGVPPGEAVSALFSGLGGQEGVLEARIEQAGEDALGADDRAFAVLEKQKQMKVVLVTERGHFLDKDLKLDPDIDYRGRTSPGEMDPQGRFEFAEGVAPDLVVLDGVVPESLPPGGYLIFGALPPLAGFAGEGEQEDPVILDWNGSHPVMRFVNLESLWVKKARTVSFPRAARVLVESDQGPLVLAYDSQGIRLLYVAFELSQSNWPIRLSYPIFLSNGIRWLGGRGREELGRIVHTGGVIPIAPVAEGEVEVEAPSGETTSITGRGGGERFFGGTGEVGLYTVSYPEGREERYAVNLLDAAESNLEPAETVHLSEREVEATAGAIETNREIWWPFVLAAFLVLLLEWYIYNRRVQI